ncbi:methyltransferase domain-containing protein [Agromyces bauzanensis]|uniref:Ubiquinone biosynthesis protein n=1 Tax=Agromyces bauzanensis TaxID=1308924 RepID=A0A917PGV3_9MICO|nr:methyltransferase domain-containing protein [Agromyces bauzanensis]GGJ77553.1 ubiquinone biosynthesis protein [Agromyces bauzanensis]
MSIDWTWLRCPNCFGDLSPVDDRAYGCDHGHRFDPSKHGYLTLLPPRAPRTTGDDREMLVSRAALLDRGAYRPIAEELARAALPANPGQAEVRLRVADLGCGTGYYSRFLSEALPDADFLLADRSPDAVRAALRAVPSASGVVLDIWRPLPLRDDVADVVLNVFAPRNPSEFARILRPGGRLVVVVPHVHHLRELRELGLLLDVPAQKAETVTDRLAAVGLVPRGAARVQYVLEADPDTRALLAGMGPSAHHAVSLAGRPAGGDLDVTIAVDVLAFQLISPSG